MTPIGTTDGFHHLRTEARRVGKTYNHTDDLRRHMSNSCAPWGIRRRPWRSRSSRLLETLLTQPSLMIPSTREQYIPTKTSIQPTNRIAPPKSGGASRDSV